MPSISVVVPTYNRAGLLPRTLDAILAQTLPADEVIVVDDGSTDETPAVLAGYAGRVRSIRIGNSGDLAARNAGMAAASGELLAFCDSDDLWNPEFLAVMAAQWRDEPDLSACYANFRVLRGDTLSERTKFDDAPASFWSGLRPTGAMSGVFDAPAPERLIAFQPFFPSCLMASAAKFLAGGGWDEGAGRGRDFATGLRIMAMPRIGVVRQALVAIRKHDGNFSGDTERMNLGDADVLDYVLRTRPELSGLSAMIRRSAARRRQEALDSAFSRRDFGAVREIFALLPAEVRAVKPTAKHAIASLPTPLGNLIASLVTR